MNPRPWALSVDYGTSNTVAAIAEPGRAPRIMQFSGSASLPSGVYLDPLSDNDPWLDGRPADRARRNRLGSRPVMAARRQLDNASEARPQSCPSAFRCSPSVLLSLLPVRDVSLHVYPADDRSVRGILR